MNKLLLSCLTMFSLTANAEPAKYLHYKFSENVVVTITSIPCPINEYKQEYPYAAAATRTDGAQLVGCYGPKGFNDIEIQWYKGNKTVLPANVFLPQVTNFNDGI